MSDIEYCDHCGQKMMVYRRNIRPGMALALKQLFNLNRPSKISDLQGLTRGIMADFTKMKYWNLIERTEGEYWKITELGKDFVLGRSSIPKYKYIYNNKIQEEPEHESNPDLFIWDIAPKEMSREIVLSEASKYSDFSSEKKQGILI